MHLDKCKVASSAIGSPSYKGYINIRICLEMIDNFKML